MDRRSIQLSLEEKGEVVAICDHLSRLKFSKTCPYAFTAHGALMAANVLSSPEAVKMSVHLRNESSLAKARPKSNNSLI